MIERGYELRYVVDVESSVGAHTESRKVFLTQASFDDALAIAQRIVEEAEMDEACTGAKIISLSPKIRQKGAKYDE